MNNDFKESLILLKNGFSLLGKTLYFLFNKYAHKYPYIYMLLIVLGYEIYIFSNIIPERIETDKLEQKLYKQEQSIDSMQMIIDSYKYEKFQKHIDDSIKHVQFIEEQQRQTRIKKYKAQQQIKKDSIY